MINKMPLDKRSPWGVYPVLYAVGVIPALFTLP
jgi:hypothetical protein